jgi:hypothetical protein
MYATRQQRCIAYVRAGWDPHAWIPCSRRRQCGSLYCRCHEDAVNGAILGLWAHGFPERGRTAGTAHSSQRNSPTHSK